MASAVQKAKNCKNLNSKFERAILTQFEFEIQTTCQTKILLPIKLNIQWKHLQEIIDQNIDDETFWPNIKLLPKI